MLGITNNSEQITVLYAEREHVKECTADLKSHHMLVNNIIMQAKILRSITNG